MSFHYADAIDGHTSIGGGLDAYIYHPTPTIVVKTVRRDRTQEEEAIAPRFFERQEQETGTNSFRGRLINVKEYEDPALVARWIQQLASALEYLEKMGFCHNDLHASNCLLDRNLNLKLADFGATTIGHPLEGTLPPRARPILAGPLKGTYGLCSAKTEQFAVGTLLYFMVYGHEPFDDTTLSAREWVRRFWEMQFPELERNEIFHSLISACWHNAYPTMALLAYDFRRKTRDMICSEEYTFIDSAKETKTCEELVRKGLLGPELALCFQST